MRLRDTGRERPGSAALWLVGAIVLSSVALAQTHILVHSLDRATIESRLDSFSKRDSYREQRLKALFLQAGCSADQLSEPKVRGALPNLICVMPGRSPDEIIVGAHYDHVPAGEGVVDNWTGASLLPSLAESLRGIARKHTFVFVAFSGEEEGLLGSRSYVSHMSAEDRSVAQAMVNLDTLGLGPTEVWVSQGNPGLVNALFKTAQDMKLPLAGMNVDGAGDSDSESFAQKKIPSITIHSVTQSTWAVLHSPRDVLSAVKFDDYYNSYLLLEGYLAVLDAGLSTEEAAGASPH